MNPEDGSSRAIDREKGGVLAGNGFALALALLVLVAGGLRYGAMQATYPVEILGDELYYVSVANQIAHGNGHYHPESDSRAWRPPAHAFALSWSVSEILPLQPATLIAFARPLIVSQIIWGALLVGLTAWLGSLLFDRAVGLTAGVAAAFYPPFIAHSHYLWSETFFACGLTAGLCAAVWARNRRDFWSAAVCGGVFGTAVLTREIAGFAALASAVWWLQHASEGERALQRKRAALLLLCAGLVVLPWTLRNYSELDSFVPVGTVGWYAAAEGNSLDEPRWLASIGARGFEFRRRYFAVAGEIERSRFARQWTAERIAAEQPAWLFKKTVRSVAQLFSPESYLLYKIERGSYRGLGLGTVRLVLAFSVAFYLAIMSLAILGVALAPPRARRLLWLLLGGVLFVHVLANSGVRFRLPWMPLAIAFASYALVHARAERRHFKLRHGLASGFALLILFGVCVPYYASHVTALWRFGSGALYH